MEKEIMLFVPNEKGFYSTKLNGEKMIYLQNRVSPATGVGLFEVHAICIKPTYTLMTCESLVETERLSLTDLLHHLGTESNISIEYTRELKLPTGQYVYRIEGGKYENCICYKKKGCDELSFIIDRDIVMNDHNRSRTNQSKFFWDFTRCLTTASSEINALDLGTFSDISDSDIIKYIIPVIELYNTLTDFVEVFYNGTTKTVVICETKYSTYIRTYALIAGNVIKIQNAENMEIDDYKRDKNYVSKNKIISDFCVEHYIALYHVNKFTYPDLVLHDPCKFDFTTNSHLEEVEESVANANVMLKRLGAVTSSKNLEQLKTLQGYNWKRFCRI